MRLTGRIALSTVAAAFAAGSSLALAWGAATLSFWGSRVDTAHAPPSLAALAALASVIGFVGAVSFTLGGLAAPIAAVAIVLEATED